MAQRLLSAQDVADQLNVCRRTIYRAFHKEELDGIRIGENNALRFNQKSVNAYIEKRKNKPARKTLKPT
jgi:excisionase family DNA binding protein